MNHYELLLISDFLNQLAAVQSNEGCNDLELPNTQAYRDLIQAAHPDVELPPIDSTESLITYNWMIARHLAEKVKRQALNAIRI